MNWVWFPGPTERKNVESISAFVHQLTHVKTGLMGWDIGQRKRVQSRPKTLVLILGRTITSRADRRDLQCTLAGKSESLSSSVYVGRNLVFPLGQMPPSAAGRSQADHGVLPGNIFSGLPNEQLVLSLYLLTDSFLPPWVPSSFGSLKERLFNLETLSASLCQASSWWGRQHDVGVGVMRFWS